MKSKTRSYAIHLEYGELKSCTVFDYLDEDCFRSKYGSYYRGHLARLKDGNKTCSGPCRNTNDDKRGPSCEVEDEKGKSTRREYCDIPFCGMYGQIPRNALTLGFCPQQWGSRYYII